MGLDESGAPSQSAWNEDEWERFLKQEDARTAKFQELFETLYNEPRRNKLIIDELGLCAPCGGALPEGKQNNGYCFSCDERSDCEFHEMRLLIEPRDCRPEECDSPEMLAAFEEVERIPAYQCAHEFAMLLQEFFEICPPDPIICRHYNGNHSEHVWRLLDAAALVAAQLAGGHGIGYEPDCICGNIANCKRALKNATYCLYALNRMNLGRADGRSLIRKAHELNAMIVGWIENLRGRAY